MSSKMKHENHLSSVASCRECFFELIEENNRLKQQLAEKDKHIEELLNMIEKLEKER